jgi:DNA-binding winged helix-turn-helix (wHTH) protein
MAIDNGNYYEFFDFRLDLVKQQLLNKEQPVQLTHKAFQILILLVQNSGQITKKEDIFEQLWADSFVEDANLTQHIYVLRKALGPRVDGQSYIETVPRQGYRFTLSPEQIVVGKYQSDKSVPENKENISAAPGGSSYISYRHLEKREIIIDEGFQASEGAMFPQISDVDETLDITAINKSLPPDAAPEAII